MHFHALVIRLAISTARNTKHGRTNLLDGRMGLSMGRELLQSDARVA